MVFLFLEHGFEEMEAIAVLDVLRRAGIELKSVGVSGRVLTGAHGVPVTADLSFEEYQAVESSAEMLIVPGGAAVQTLCNNEALKESFRRYRGEKVAAICAAPIFLGELGLLRGKKVTAFPIDFVLEKVAAAGAELIDAPAVIDGNLVTGKSAGTAAEFAIHVVELLRGPEKAAEVRKGLVLQ